MSRRVAAYVSTSSVVVAFAGALTAFAGLLGQSPHERRHISTAWTWIQAGSYKSGFAVLVDPLSVMMMLIVSGVGALIVAYSIGYMDGDDEERRYFAYMSLFVFSMLLLVEGGNLILLLAGWGRVGAGQRPDPRGDDGDGRRLPDRPHARHLRGGAEGAGPRRGTRHRDAADRRSDRPRAGGHQARHRVLDDVADRLHVPRRRGR